MMDLLSVQLKDKVFRQYHSNTCVHNTRTNADFVFEESRRQGMVNMNKMLVQKNDEILFYLEVIGNANDFHW